MFANMKIGSKLVISIAIIFIVLLSVVITSLYNNAGIRANLGKNELSLSIVQDILHTRIAEKSFLINGDRKYSAEVIKRIGIIGNKIDAMKSMLADGNNVSLLDGMAVALNTYKSQFSIFISANNYAGYNDQSLQTAADLIIKNSEEIQQNILAAIAARTKLLNIIITFGSLGMSILVFVIFLFIARRNITQPLKKSTILVGAIAEGDLTPRLNMRMNDEIGILGKSIDKMTERLHSIVGSSRANVQTILADAQNLHTAAEKLSSSAVSESSTIEQISASMLQMVTNIRQNADISQKTVEISSQAATDAEESGMAVNNAVEAMNEIASKISVIEDIARNTNLLALNAAIEAARAGEHGKGFAVVASEVRKLAENSQRAAAEISELSKASTEVSQKAVKMIDKLVPDIKKTSDLIREISLASEEQNDNALQINSSITSIDSTIQDSLKMSETVNTASKTLSAQAEQLLAALKFFKLASLKKQDTETTEKNPAASAVAIRAKSATRSLPAAQAAGRQHKRFIPETGITYLGESHYKIHRAR